MSVISDTVFIYLVINVLLLEHCVSIQCFVSVGDMYSSCMCACVCLCV